MKRICGSLLLLGLSISAALAAPASRPAAFEYTNVSGVDKVALRTMPAVDVAKLKAEDLQRDKRGDIPRFGLVDLRLLDVHRLRVSGPAADINNPR